uniref:Uncharacterized protein n=1 Tax=Acrobeloides nanus TaxID=290746 RepID=A0A914EFQ2_9BILA
MNGSMPQRSYGPGHEPSKNTCLDRSGNYSPGKNFEKQTIEVYVQLKKYDGSLVGDLVAKMPKKSTIADLIGNVSIRFKINIIPQLFNVHKFFDKFQSCLPSPRQYMNCVTLCSRVRYPQA